jgi:RNA polymerase sigma factor (sigma-70 family)
MTVSLAEAIDIPGPGWIPAIGDAEAFAPLPVPIPSVVADILEARRQELALLRPAAFSTVPEPPPLLSEAPANAPPGDFARRIESQLAFLRNAARRWYRDKPHADDLVQDTVVQALANAHLWRGDQPDSNLRGWLFTIMRNRFLAGRVRWKRSETALDAIAAADECVPAVASRPEARLMMRDVERALALLPSRQRTAIRLIGIDGLSYNEAARLTGMTVAALRCHLSRCRERLRELVEGRTASPVRVRPLPLSRPAHSHSEQSPNPAPAERLHWRQAA